MKKIKMLGLFIGIVLLSFMSSTGYNLSENNIILQKSNLKDSYSVGNFYKKIDLDDGTLGEDARPIGFIFVKTTVESGNYEIELSSGPGDLYKVNGMNLYIMFDGGYFGYAGYGEKCILKVDYYSATVYKLD